MNTQKLTDVISDLYDADQSWFVESHPGMGKTAITKQMMEQKIREGKADFFMDFRAAYHEAPDIHGFNVPDLKGKKVVQLYPARWLMNEKARGLIFMDELTIAPKMVQGACYQLIHERCIGDLPLPIGVRRAGAGNLVTSRAIVNPMGSALRSRFVILKLDSDPDAWVAWAIPNGVHEDVISYIRFKPEHLNAFDPTAGDDPFPCERTWAEGVSKHLVCCGFKESTSYEIIKGSIGEAVATTFVGFIKLKNELPTKEEIYSAPLKAIIPNQPAALFMVCGMLASHVKVENVDSTIKYSLRLPEAFSVMLISDILKRNKENQEILTNSPTFVDWTLNHYDIIADSI